MIKLVRGRSMRVLKANPDVGLLILRVLAALSLFLKHGWEKPTHFAAMAAHFPDPIHIGPVASLAFALVADAVCSILVAVGLFDPVGSAGRVHQYLRGVELGPSFCLLWQSRGGPRGGLLPLHLYFRGPVLFRGRPLQR